MQFEIFRFNTAAAKQNNELVVTVYVAVRFWHHRSSALRFDPPSCLANVASGSAASVVFALDSAETPTAAAVTFSAALSLLHNKTSHFHFRQFSFVINPIVSTMHHNRQWKLSCRLTLTNPKDKHISILLTMTYNTILQQYTSTSRHFSTFSRATEN